MNYIDITIDFETLALEPTAAIMSMGAVAWDRTRRMDDDKNKSTCPFIMSDAENPSLRDENFFNVGVDVRSCITSGLTVDPKTVDWWAHRSEDAKGSLFLTEPKMLREAMEDFFGYVHRVQTSVGADDVCLWSQGSDYDIAILRNICHVLDMDLSQICDYRNFRDCRTLIYEDAAFVYNHHQRQNAKSTELYKQDICFSNAYSDIPTLPTWTGNVAHDPVYDCVRSTWSTWHSMQRLEEALKSDIRQIQDAFNKPLSGQTYGCMNPDNTPLDIPIGRM